MIRVIRVHIDCIGELRDFDFDYEDIPKWINTDKDWEKRIRPLMYKFTWFMLCGFSKGKNKNGRFTSRYSPCGGFLVFEVDGKRYRVERTIDKVTETFHLFDEETNTESTDYGYDIFNELSGSIRKAKSSTGDKKKRSQKGVAVSDTSSQTEKKRKRIIGGPVSVRARQVRQPYGGYLPLKTMTSISLGEGMEALDPNEKTNAGLVGLAVDYLTRFQLGTSVEDAFKISMRGATVIHEELKAEQLMKDVKGLDRVSIINAVKLSGFDVCYRKGKSSYKPVDEIIPDDTTIENIRVMVKRSLKFFEIYGPSVLDGFDLAGGYTKLVYDGDGDFMTKDTLWDFKVSKCLIKKEQTLQLLMYWRMGLRSIHPEFQDVQYLGIYNPRKNVVSRIAVADIPEDVIKKVETYVIGYKESI